MDSPDEGMHETIVRIPKHWPAGEQAGFVHAAVMEAMDRAGIFGPCAVVFKDGTQWKMFTEGVENVDQPLVFDND